MNLPYLEEDGEALARGDELEDVFAGHVELTASERAYVHSALVEHYMSGGWTPDGVNRRAFARRVASKLTLRLERMVTPDRTRLVTVDEHAAIVGALAKDAS